jgi:hypothetical protein
MDKSTKYEHREAWRQVFGRTLRRMFKRQTDRLYEPDRQRLTEILTGVPGASPVWCGGCGEIMTPIVLADGNQTRLVAISCLGPCCVSLPVRAGVLMGGERGYPLTADPEKENCDA